MTIEKIPLPTVHKRYIVGVHGHWPTYFADREFYDSITSAAEDVAKSMRKFTLYVFYPARDTNHVVDIVSQSEVLQTNLARNSKTLENMRL